MLILRPNKNMADDCQICFDKCNGSTRKACKCPYCQVVYCRECVGNWLTTLIDEPRCPGEQCKKGWSREYLDSVMTKVWRDGTYREYREKLLMDRERALLPTTQPRIEAMNEAKRIMRETIDPMRQRRRDLQNQLRALQMEDQGIQTQIWDLTHHCERLRTGVGVDEAAAKQRNVFIRRCPSEGCRGFLSSAWKCGVCELYSCPECHDVKGVARDSPHTCDPANVETAKLIAKDTKPCPKCGEMITKIDGCDQMWCVSCHTAFSWRSGQIASGVVHNPHFYEWQRRVGGGTAPRAPGDIPCGGMAEWTVVRRAICDSRTYPAWVSILELAHRRITHVINVDMINLNRDGVNLNDNIDLRISYLLKEVSDEAMMSTLIQREKRWEKERELRRVYETLTGAATDIFRRILAVREESAEMPTFEAFRPLVLELDELRKFINDALDVLRRRYNSTIHGFDSNWERLSLKKSRGGEETTTDIKTSYGLFQDDLTAFQALVLPTIGDTDDGVLLMKPFMTKIKRLARFITTFPAINTNTRRLAEHVVEWLEANIKVLQTTTGIRAERWTREYNERLRDRRRDALTLWAEHVKTLELVMTAPATNTII